MTQTVKERLLSYLKFKGLSQGKFERMCGLSNGYVNNLRRSVTAEKLAVIKSVCTDLNSDWLLTGEGKMLNYDDETLQNNDIDEEENSSSRLIPFYDAETSGGYNGIVGSSTSEAEMVGYIQAGGWFDSKETAAIRHVGDSMVEYPSGCILAVREVTERRLLVPGRNYVIETSEFRVTKRVQRGSSPNTIALYSSNDETYPDGRLVHEPFEVEFEDIRRIYSILGYIVNQSGEFRLIKP